jgi:hypothetical protein
MTLLARVNTSIKEFLEAVFKGFFPKEFLIAVLIDEVLSCKLNIMEIVVDNLHSTIELELIFDFNQIVTGACVQSGQLDSNRDEIINDALDQVVNTISA